MRTNERGFGFLSLLTVVGGAAACAMLVALGVEKMQVDADAPELSGWQQQQVQGTVRALETRRHGGGRFSSSYDDWVSFVTNEYLVLNGRPGAFAVCPQLALHGVNQPGLALSALRLHADATQELAMSVLVPRPSPRLRAGSCPGIVEKDDHFEYQGRTVVFATAVKAQPKKPG